MLPSNKEKSNHPTFDFIFYCVNSKGAENQKLIHN
jgi:hypothetical protein